MKRILLLLTLLCIINLNLNALTMKEKIQQDLSKVGVKQEIIDETVNWIKKLERDLQQKTKMEKYQQKIETNGKKFI